MEEKEKFEANKRHNAPFLRAFELLKKEKGLNQEQAAKLLETKSGTFSDYKNGKKKAGPDMYYRLARAFGGRLNMRFLTHESEYMMLANVPDEEMVEYALRDNNPDFDVLKKAKAESDANHTSSGTPDMSSVFNSALAKADEAIEQLKLRLKEKDELIQSLRDQLADKDKLISEQKARLIDYRRIIDSQNGLSGYPFPIGAADNPNQKATTK